jgi:mannose-6-phosphate isomerase-like protein (cupin superfamily)
VLQNLNYLNLLIKIMKRNHFSKNLLAGISIIPSSITTISKAKQKKRNDAGFKVNNGKDRLDKPISLFEGDTFFTKIASSDTENDLYIFESTRIKNGGPTEHFHYNQDEWWYILEGEFLFKIGGETFTAKKGDSVFGPRKVPHAFAKTNDGEAKVLLLFQPAGKMEAFFKAVSEGVTAKTTEIERNEFKKLHGFEVTGPALTYEKKG